MQIKQEVKIGFIAVLALFFGYLGINYLKGINLFKKTSTYYVTFHNLNSVEVATPVIISGYNVGSVQEIDFDYTGGFSSRLRLELKPDLKLPVGSVVKVKTNLLSGAQIVIEPGDFSSGKFFAIGSELPVKKDDGDILTQATEKIMPAINEAIPTLTTTLKRLDSIANNPAIDKSLQGLANLSTQMTMIASNLNASMVTIPQTMKNINEASHSLMVLGKEVEKIKVDSLIQNLDEASSSLKTLSAQLNTKNGTAGLLLNDPSLYYRIDSLAKAAEALLTDLKANPKKYVKLSLF